LHFHSRLRILAPLVLLAALPTRIAAMGADTDPGLERIVAAQTDVRSLEGRFRQTKTLSLFDETIETSGTIVIEKPDFYCWIYDAPERRVFFVDGTRTGSVEPGSGTESAIALDGTALADVIQSVTALISGNLQNSDLGNYEIVPKPSTDDALSYAFVPQSADAQALFEEVTISFDPRTGLARRLEIVESNGDRSVMAFDDWHDNVAVNRAELVE
jgi:outer membrane lipoprotein-sorting protein